jgi:monoamine oxidase
VRQGVHVKKIFESMRDYYSNVEGGDLHELSMRQYIEDETETRYDFLPEGGYSKVVRSLFGHCSATLKMGEKVLKIDYSGEKVQITTDKDTYWCRHVIASLPLGVLQANRVEFVPELPETYQSNLQKIGNGSFNKIYLSFEKPFWGNRKGYINFVTKGKTNRYPVAFIMEEKNRHILCFFASANPYHEISRWSDETILADIRQFLRKFKFGKEEDFKVRDFKMTRWHQDELSMGSYSFVKVGQDQEECSAVLRKSLAERIWLVGEHLHPTMNACAHAAFETGVWAGNEVAQHIKAK